MIKKSSYIWAQTQISAASISKNKLHVQKSGKCFCLQAYFQLSSHFMHISFMLHHATDWFCVNVNLSNGYGGTIVTTICTTTNLSRTHKTIHIIEGKGWLGGYRVRSTTTGYRFDQKAKQPVHPCIRPSAHSVSQSFIQTTMMMMMMAGCYFPTDFLLSFLSTTNWTFNSGSGCLRLS